eukprot:5700605-Alexandrium_andersonii.AAC.1
MATSIYTCGEQRTRTTIVCVVQTPFCDERKAPGASPGGYRPPKRPLAPEAPAGGVREGGSPDGEAPGA